MKISYEQFTDTSYSEVLYKMNKYIDSKKILSDDLINIESSKDKSGQLWTVTLWFKENNN